MKKQNAALGSETETARPPTDSVNWIFCLVFLLLCIAAVLVASGR
jgi:hypothetical protein